MLVEFSIVPVGVGSSIGDYLAEVIDIVDRSGMPYKVNPMVRSLKENGLRSLPLSKNVMMQ